jgi:predicted permease
MLGTILWTAVNAVFPIVALILFGYLLKRKGFFSENFLKTGSALVFKVCLPCMLFINVYEISGMDAIAWDLVIYCMAAVVVLYLLGLALAVVTTKDMKRRGVIWQVTYRSNFAIIGISLSTALGGDLAAAVGAILLTLMVPLFNVFAVIALEYFTEDSSGHKHTARKMVLDILKNPLVIAVFLGLGCMGIRALQKMLLGNVAFTLNRDLAFLYTVVKNLKSLATPLALLVLGGQFQFSVVKGMFKEIAVGTLYRVVLAPLLGVGCAILLSRCTNWLSCGPESIPAMLALFGSPVAVSSAVMAGEMGGDEQLAAQLVVWTSIVSIVTIFVFSCILMSAGLIAV